MGWTLEIHHIDVGGAGDATLILAIETEGTTVTRTRSMLVDGGLGGAAAQRVHPYLSKIGLDKLDAVLSTHYDADHLDGITKLLEMPAPRYRNTIVYDQGFPEEIRALTTGSGYRLLLDLPDENVLRYFYSIGTRVHPTKCVMADSMPESGNAIGFLDNEYLIGKELLWWQPTRPLGAYTKSSGVTVESGSPIPAPEPAGAPPDGAPTVTCIAANGYVLNHDGQTRHLISAVRGNFDPNGKSLALEVKFGNFKYYLGGDLTSVQEDGPGRTPGLRDYLNYQSNPATPVKAMKASHHGSQHSTSAKFLGQLQPTVVVISNGTDNTHGHPDQETIDRIDASSTVQRFFLTGPSFNRSPALNLGPKGVVAGAWVIPEGTSSHKQTLDGTIVLKVNESAAMQVDININAPDDDDMPIAFKNRSQSYAFP